MRLRALSAAPAAAAARKRDAQRDRKRTLRRGLAGLSPLSWVDHPERLRDPDRGSRRNPPSSPERGKVRQPGSMEASRSVDHASTDRDFLAAVSDRVVVFDGGMGATLEQFDLTSEDYGGLAGQVPRGARPPSPRRDRGGPHVDARRGRRGRRDRHLPGLAAEARRVGPRRAHARDQHEGRANCPQGGRAPSASSPGSIGPTGFLPASDDPTLGGITFAELVEVFTQQAQRPRRGRRRPDHHRDGAGHPRGQGGDLRRPRGVQADRPHAADPDLGLAASAGRQDAARHRHSGGADDAGRRSTST